MGGRKKERTSRKAFQLVRPKPNHSSSRAWERVDCLLHYLLPTPTPNTHIHTPWRPHLTSTDHLPTLPPPPLHTHLTIIYFTKVKRAGPQIPWCLPGEGWKLFLTQRPNRLRTNGATFPQVPCSSGWEGRSGRR